MKPNAIKISDKDNVAVVIKSIAKGEEIQLKEGTRLVAQEDIPFGHKVALQPITQGGDVVRYGEVILRASRDISAGSWVHLHNTVSFVY